MRRYRRSAKFFFFDVSWLSPFSLAAASRRRCVAARLASASPGIHDSISSFAIAHFINGQARRRRLLFFIGAHRYYPVCPPSPASRERTGLMPATRGEGIDDARPDALPDVT